MDFMKIIDWASKYLADYFAVLFSTLQDPVPAYKPDRRYKTKKINPKLMGFALISIAIGATINSVIPNRPPNAEVFTTSIITLIMWIVYSMVIYLVSTLLGGKAHILNVTTISLQLFGAVYVVSNLAAFLWGTASTNPYLYELISRIDTFKEVADNPLTIFYFVQIIILTVYIPRILSTLEIRDSGRIIVITIASALFIFSCGISPYIPVLLSNDSSKLLPSPPPAILYTATPTPAFQTATGRPTESNTDTPTVTGTNTVVYVAFSNTPSNQTIPSNTPLVAFQSPTPFIPFTPPVTPPTIIVFSPTPTDTPSGPRECNDGIDNDGDGFIDWPADQQCRNRGDDDES